MRGPIAVVGAGMPFSGIESAESIAELPGGG